jgi:hypothetical protein
MTRLDRRTLLRAAGVTVAAGGGAAAMLATGSGTAMAATFDGETVAATSHDGRIRDVTITPEVTLAWEGATTTLGGADIRITAAHDGSTDTVLERTELPVPDEPEATRTYTDLGTTSIIDNGPYERADFRAGEDGATAETTVQLTLEAILRDDDGEVVAETTAEPTFVVRVTNGEVTIEVTGSMNPAVRTEEEDD